MFLDQIVGAKRAEVAAVARDVSLARLEALAARQPAPRDFAAALRGAGAAAGEKVRLIAEIKRASPSKGLLRADLDPAELACLYAGNGAAAISVLTETRYFQGSLENLLAAGAALGPARTVPLLRKDFILGPYQVVEARAYGADALLLIAAILSDGQLRDLLQQSHDLGLQCLVEVHDEQEAARAVAAGAPVIGINNRDLRTFKVDLATTARLRPLIPADRVVVSESGIRDRADVARLQEWGVQAMLVGEALVTAPDVAARMRELTCLS